MARDGDMKSETYAVLILLADAPSDIISGGAGWTATAILVGVLSWIFFKLLPAKDLQLEKMIEGQNIQRENDRQLRIKEQEIQVKEREADREAWIKEREANRIAQHGVSNTFQQAIGEVVKENNELMSRMEERWRAEHNEIRKEFRDTLNVILGHCEKEGAKLIEAFRTEMVRITDGRRKGNPP